MQAFCLSSFFGSLCKNLLEKLTCFQRTSLLQHLQECYDLNFIYALAAFPEMFCIFT